MVFTLPISQSYVQNAVSPWFGGRHYQLWRKLCVCCVYGTIGNVRFWAQNLIYFVQSLMMLGWCPNSGLNWWAFVTSIWLSWYVVYPIIQSSFLRKNVVLSFDRLRHLLWGNSCVCCVWSSKGVVFGLETHDVQCRSELVGICYLNLISLTCLCQLHSWANKDITPDFLALLGVWLPQVHHITVKRYLFNYSRGEGFMFIADPTPLNFLS